MGLVKFGALKVAGIAKGISDPTGASIVVVILYMNDHLGLHLVYVAIADDLIRTEGDNKTIGLIICKSKNDVLAKYAVGTSKEPIGVSEYELSNLLPTPEEIEKVLREDENLLQE